MNEPDLRRTVRRWAARLPAALALSLAGAALAQPIDPRAAYEAKLLAELRAVSADAAVAFQQANEAREQNDLLRAREYYAEVRKMAPDFVPATRRQCSVELRLDHRAEAIALCREALKAQETPESLSSLAGALSSSPATPADFTEATHLTLRAMDLAPGDADAFEVACGIALKTDDRALLHRCATQLLTLAPTQATTLIYYTNLALAEGRPADAQAALDRAHGNGLPEVVYLALTERVRGAMPWPTRAAHFIRERGAIGGGVLGLFLTGVLFWRSRFKPKQPRSHR